MNKKLNIKALLGLLTIILVTTALVIIAVPVIAAPTTYTITLASGTTSQTAGYSTANTSTDPLNPTLYSGGGTWTAASVIASPPGPWVTIAGAQWVSTISTNSGDDGDYPGDGWRLFKDEFTIPAGSTNMSIALQVAADNAYEIYLNNVLIDSTANWAPSCTVYGVSPVPFGSGNPYLVATNYTITPSTGLNTLMFVVRNWAIGSGNNPVGLNYYATVAYTEPEPTTPPPPASIGGTVGPIDKLQLILPWFVLGMGCIVLLYLGTRRLLVKKSTNR